MTLLPRLFKSALIAALMALPAVAARAQDAADLIVRFERLEGQLRQLTGSLEQLQFRNQQLEQQIKRMQDDNEYRFQQLGAKAPPSTPARPTLQPAPAPIPALPGRRSDVFDPAQQPNAPGAPRVLGGGAIAAPPAEDAPIGAPGGRAPGAPLDLATLANNAPIATPPPDAPDAASTTLPPPPPRNLSSTGAVAAVAPPSNSPRDAYDLAYGYVLRKEYALAEDAFRTFLKSHANDRLAAYAQYWLGETLFQRQRYQDAADSFLVVVRNHESAGKAPDALLRLGQSLAGLGQKEMACASYAEVARKYPRATANVKRAVEQEQKRARC